MNMPVRIHRQAVPVRQLRLAVVSFSILLPSHSNMVAFKAKRRAGIPYSCLLAALRFGLVILLPLPAPTITRAVLLPVPLSPSAFEWLRVEGTRLTREVRVTAQHLNMHCGAKP